MTPLEQLKSAQPQEVKVYFPYCPDGKRRLLGHAISLYKEKNLEGARSVMGGEDIPFVASWNVCMLPIDETRCRVVFEGNSELSYEIKMETSEFVNFLIDVLMNFQRAKTVDFPKPFYRKLLRVDE